MADLPESFTYGRVVGRYILGVADSADAGSLPDAVPAVGGINFTPKTSNVIVNSPESTLVVNKPIPTTLNADGRIVDAQLALGVTLTTGVWVVSYNITGVTIATHDIVVTEEHMATPVQLPSHLPPSGVTIVPSQYAELSARIDLISAPDLTGYLTVTDANSTYALKGEAGGGGGISLDTDGVPYYDPAGTGSIALDTDNVPYLV